jgi:hypothetical protein
MPIHPCADGLTKECFRAYPAWARQAFAYKLLHILLPKQLTKNLPRGLNLPLVPPGIVLPPGVELPPGTIIAPDVSFPPGWTPGDLPPPGVITPPGVSPTPPESGDTPPLYVEVWEPGPIGGSRSFAVPPFDIGSLLLEQGITQTSSKLGDVSYWSDLGMPMVSWISARVAAIDIKIGKNNAPTDMVLLEIWRCASEYKPFALCGGGASTPKDGASLPAFSLGQDYIRFLFPNKPLLWLDVEYAIIAARSGAYDAVNYYKIGQNTYPTQTYYYKLPDLSWYSRSGGIFNFRIWGDLV